MEEKKHNTIQSEEYNNRIYFQQPFSSDNIVLAIKIVTIMTIDAAACIVLMSPIVCMKTKIIIMPAQGL
ncbi:MAG: hypothetical protein M3Y53_06725 [Thermoproteota archaeon]|nr:hypothetical protein [Thermoproteota archaeon]